MLFDYINPTFTISYTSGSIPTSPKLLSPSFISPNLISPNRVKWQSSPHHYSNTFQTYQLPRQMTDENSLFSKIYTDQIILSSFIGPFGKRPIIYSDYTASGRALKFIENYIHHDILPTYANTHTEANETAKQTSHYREESRSLIKKFVGANDEDSLIFTGSGSTGAIHKLVNVLNFEEPPIVIASPYEHHSNLLIWRELTKDVITVEEDSDGNIDLNDLKKKLKHYSQDCYSGRIKIGTFSAASNITGILSDVDRISILLHQYSFLAFFDYASAAPYVDINMNKNRTDLKDGHLAYKDAVFISTHKFIGGVQTPGILVAKSKLFNNAVPSGCGGGTVFFVTKNHHEYLKNIEEREEGGTAAIVESIRAGLAFQLKNDCGIDNIEKREQYYSRKAINYLKNIKNLKILGSTIPERLPIFSFVIKNEQTGLYLHHTFVTSLLNDLFGIQTRSGCACAGPYAQELLGISSELADEYIRIMHEGSFKNSGQDGHVIFKPGFTRFGLTYFMPENVVDYILESIKFVAKYGWIFLPFYDFDMKTGSWSFKKEYFNVKKESRTLTNIPYRNNSPPSQYNDSHIFNSTSNYNNYLVEANNILNRLLNLYPTLERIGICSIPSGKFNESSHDLLWFLMPSVVFSLINSYRKSRNYFPKMLKKVPFQPKDYDVFFKF